MAAWAWCLATGAAGIGGYYLLPDETAQDFVYTGFGIASALLIVVGIRRNRPASPAAWYSMAGAQAVWSIADLVFDYYDFVAGPRPDPSLADVLYLLGYLPVFLGLVLLHRATRVSSDPATAVLDAAVMTVVAGLLAWQFLITPMVTSTNDALSTAVAVAYPVVDVVVIAGLALIAATASQAMASAWWFRLLCAAVLALLITDGFSRVSSLTSSYTTGTELDAGWLASYVLWAAAALHPSVSAAHAADDWSSAETSKLTVGRLAVLTVAVLCAPATLIVRNTVLPDEGSEWPVTACTMALFLLLVARLAGLLLRARRLARTDDLTGVANRRWFTDVLGRVLAEDRDAVSLILVDLNRLADTNDAFGYGAGDDLLREISSRLVAASEPGDVVGRVDGDEFAVMLRGIGTAEDALSRAMVLHAELTRPFATRDLTLLVEIRSGVACATDIGRGPDVEPAVDLLRRADLALNAAATSPSGIVAYTAALDRVDVDRIALLGELRAALGTDALLLHYQPQLELRTGQIIGVEALVRWQHPQLGLLSPDAFLPAAERTGLMTSLTEQVLGLALADCARWRRAGLDLSVAVNLSAHNLHDGAVVGTIGAELHANGVPANRLTCEITETSVMTDPGRALATMAGLAAMGVRLSVDDYGTGHSSLAYLQRLPVSELKLDRSFVTGMSTDGTGAVIVRSTIELARHLALDVVAEGVEDEAVLTLLRDLGCFAAQGYHVGRPVAAGQVIRLAQRRADLTAPPLR